MNYKQIANQLNKVCHAIRSEAGIYDRRMKALVKATPEAQKKEGVFYMSRNIWESLGKPDCYEGFTVCPFNVGRNQAVIYPKSNVCWDDKCDPSTDETPVK